VALIRTARGKRRGEMQVTKAPRYSRASMGGVEPVNQTLAAQARRLSLAALKHLGSRLAAEHPLMPQLVRRAAWLLTRLLVVPSGRTAYETVRGRV
jgi:hypothetical protein